MPTRAHKPARSTTMKCLPTPAATTAGQAPMITGSKNCPRPRASQQRRAPARRTSPASWGSVTYATYYFIYRGTSSSGPFTYLTYTSSTSYVDACAFHTYYYYKITAYASGYESDLSADPAAMGWRILPTPTGIAASTMDANEVAVSWTAVSGASGYTVYRYNLTTWPAIGSPTSSPYNYTSATPGDPVLLLRCRNAERDRQQLVRSVSGYRAMSAPTGLTASAGTDHGRRTPCMDSAVSRGRNSVQHLSRRRSYLIRPRQHLISMRLQILTSPTATLSRLRAPMER